MSQEDRSEALIQVLEELEQSDIGPEASEFGVDDRPEVEHSDKGDQASLFADTAENQLTLAGDDAADRCLFEE